MQAFRSIAQKSVTWFFDSFHSEPECQRVFLDFSNAFILCVVDFSSYGCECVNCNDYNIFMHFP